MLLKLQLFMVARLFEFHSILELLLKGMFKQQAQTIIATETYFLVTHLNFSEVIRS